jgi:hypothetical protein
VSGLTLVELGPPAAGSATPPPGLVVERTSLEEVASAADMARIAARAAVVWLPAWSRLERADWEALAAWLAAGRAPLARARLRIARAGAAAPVGAALVASRPGAASLRSGAPAASRGAAVAALDRPWTLVPPDSLSAHLDAVNRQTSRAVLLSEDGAARPPLRALVAPFAAMPLRVVAGRGPWRRRLEPVVVEGYRAALLAAKTWERGAARSAERP